MGLVCLCFVGTMSAASQKKHLTNGDLKIPLECPSARCSEVPARPTCVCVRVVVFLLFVCLCFCVSVSVLVWIDVIFACLCFCVSLFLCYWCLRVCVSKCFQENLATKCLSGKRTSVFPFTGL